MFVGEFARRRVDQYSFTKGAVTRMIAVTRNKIFQYYKLVISLKLYPTILTIAITNQAAHVSILRYHHS